MCIIQVVVWKSSLTHLSSLCTLHSHFSFSLFSLFILFTFVTLQIGILSLSLSFMLISKNISLLLCFHILQLFALSLSLNSLSSILFKLWELLCINKGFSLSLMSLGLYGLGYLHQILPSFNPLVQLSSLIHLTPLLQRTPETLAMTNQLLPRALTRVVGVFSSLYPLAHPPPQR